MIKNMVKKTTIWQALAALALIAGLSGCVGIRIIGNVDDPSPYFKKAQAQIEEIHRDFSDRERRSHRLHLLVHERSSHKIVKLSVPMWIVEACLKAGAEAAEGNDEFKFERRYELDWRSIRDLSKVGPGLLVEVEDDQDKVLIWLE
jgi:hypothetical protein